jgi:hypothetical protein
MSMTNAGLPASNSVIAASAPSGSSIVSDVPIEAGETLVAGDFVGISASETLVKLAVATINTYTVSTASTVFKLFFAVDKLVILEAGVSVNKIRFYDGLTDTLSAETSLTSTATVGTLFDVLQLANGNVLVCYGEGTNILVATFTSAGVFVTTSGALVAYSSLSTLTDGVTLQKGYTAGDFFMFYKNTAGKVSSTLRNSAYGSIGAVATTTTCITFKSTSYLGVEIIRGATHLCLFIGKGTTNYLGYTVLINGTTGAFLGAENFLDTTDSPASASISSYLSGVFYISAWSSSAGNIHWRTITESTAAVSAVGIIIVNASGTSVGVAKLSDSAFIIHGTGNAPIVGVVHLANGWIYYAGAPALPGANISASSFAPLGSGSLSGRYQMPSVSTNNTTTTDIISPTYSGSVFVDPSVVGTDLRPVYIFRGATLRNNATVPYGSTYSTSVEKRSTLCVISRNRFLNVVGTAITVSGTSATVDCAKLPPTLDTYRSPAAYVYRSARSVVVNGSLIVLGG